MSILDITDQCNLRCVYCCRGNKLNGAQELENDLIIDIVKQIIGIRGTFVVFQGGEPLLKKNVIDLFRTLRQVKACKPDHFLNQLRKVIHLELSGDQLKKAYMRALIDQNLPLYCLTTNGMIYSSELEVGLYDSGTYLEVSLDGPTEAINLKTRHGISFEKVVENIKHYVERLPVEISCTITEDNVNVFPEMIRFAAELGCVALKFSPVIMIGQRNDPDSLWDNLYMEGLARAITSYQSWLKQILLKVKLYPYYLQHEKGRKLYDLLSKAPNVLVELHECTAFQMVKDIYVDSAMNVYGCASMKNEPGLMLGNLRNQTLREIWDSPRRQKLQKTTAKLKCFTETGECACTAVAYSQFIKQRREACDST